METVRRRVPRLWSGIGVTLIAVTAAAILPLELVARPAAAGSTRETVNAPGKAPIYNFETDSQGWFSRLPGAGISISHKRDTVKVGEGSLEWAYNPNLPNAMLVRFQPQLAAGASTLDFWMKCTAAGAFQLYLVEHDGSVYHMHLRCPENAWTHYQVPLSDLVLGEREDANGRPDLDEVTEIVLQDLSAHHSGGKRLQGRKVWLDGLDFNQMQVPSRRQVRAMPGGGLELMFDDFDLPTLTWAGNTNAKLMLREEGNRKVLTANYRPGSTSPSRFQITNHFDPRYGRTRAVRVVARSSRPTSLTVSLREFDGTFTGPEYSATCELQSGKGWQTFVLPISQFATSPARPGTRPHLDPKRVWLMLIGDTSESPADSQTELEIDSISAQLSE